MPTIRRCVVCAEQRSTNDYYSTGRQPRSECKVCSDAEIRRVLKAGEPKMCTKCGDERHPREFYVDRGRLTSKCKRCSKDGQRLYDSTKGKAVHERYCSTAARDTAVSKYNKSEKAVAARAKWRRRANESVEHRLKQAHRTMMCGAMRRFGDGQAKDDHTVAMLGCSIPEFREHIEKQWQAGMTWDNRGVGHDKWQIDHITPLASFDLTKPEHQREAFHFSNQQPLWHCDNAKKSDNMPDGTRGRLLRCVIPRD